MTRLEIFKRATRYQADPNQADVHHRDLSGDQLAAFWGFVYRLRFGDTPREIAAELQAYDRMHGRRALHVPPRRFTTTRRRPIHRRDVHERLERDPAVTDQEVDDFHGFWRDQGVTS